MPETILYEQPLNEVIRASLRLEQLFAQLDYQLGEHSITSTRQVLSLIISILYLVDRPDLKSKLAKELNQQLSSLMKLNTSPDIDVEKFTQITEQLEFHAKHLIDNSRKIGQRLREIELLNTLRLQLAHPGGASPFDMPLYHYWLNQSAEERQSILTDWVSEFSEIRAAITLLLTLVRQHSHIDTKQAINGFHQEMLDPQSPLRMICLTISKDHAAFPEISVGRHFLSVRFFTPSIYRTPIQFSGNVEFSLAYCYL
jgi:cell division protein ZapD